MGILECLHMNIAVAKGGFMYTRNNVVLAFVLLLLIATVPAWAVTIEEEIDIGKKANEAILKKDQLYLDTHAQKKMQKLGAALVKHVKRKNIPYHFQILSQDKELNAFAVPGGYVYYTSGLWKALTHDERAGVLAHEIVHIDQRHSLDAMIKHQRRRTWTDLALILAGANTTIQQVAGMVNTLHELKYSRGDERQADEMGFGLLVKSHMNPAGLLMAMRKIMRFEEKSGSSPPKIFSSHPPTEERLAYLEQMLKDKNVPVPESKVQETRDPYEVGVVSSAKKNIVKFTSSRTLQNGDIVWLTKPGWDSKFENHARVPFARGIVTGTGTPYTAQINLISQDGNINDLPAARVSVPKLPKPDGTVGTIFGTKITSHIKFKQGDRLLAWQTVWDHNTNEYRNSIVGYVVKRDSNEDSTPLIIQRPEYAYALAGQNSFLTVASDPNGARWVAAVGSVGYVDERVEAVPGAEVKSGIEYVIMTPIWENNREIVAKARAAVIGRKTTLDVFGFEKGWSMRMILPGFDIYRKQQ